MAVINKNLSSSKRKSELLLDGAEVVEKKKKGRPRKDKMAPTPIAPSFTPVETRQAAMNVVTPEAATRQTSKRAFCVLSLLVLSDRCSSRAGAQQGASSCSPRRRSQTPDAEHTEVLQPAGERAALCVGLPLPS